VVNGGGGGGGGGRHGGGEDKEGGGWAGGGGGGGGVWGGRGEEGGGGGGGGRGGGGGERTHIGKKNVSVVATLRKRGRQRGDRGGMAATKTVTQDLPGVGCLDVGCLMLVVASGLITKCMQALRFSTSTGRGHRVAGPSIPGK